MTRIGLDLRPTEPGFKAHYGRGTGRYAAELVRELTRNPAFAGDPALQLVPVPGERLRGSRGERRLLALAPFGRITLETQFILPRSLGRLGVDLMHFFAQKRSTRGNSSSWRSWWPTIRAWPMSRTR